tara:strand:- start:776 stop:1063 length:288 start_codon:yes stop_codon:yes gene_type:complete
MSKNGSHAKKPSTNSKLNAIRERVTMLEERSAMLEYAVSEVTISMAAVLRILMDKDLLDADTFEAAKRQERELLTGGDPQEEQPSFPEGASVFGG